MEQTHASQGRRKRNIGIVLGLACLAAVVILSIAAIVISTSPMEITVKGDAEVILEFGSDFLDPGASVSFGGKQVDASVTVGGQVEQGKLGAYTLTYTGHYLWRTVTAQRTVQIVDTQAPSIVLIYNENSYTLPGHEYVEEGFVAEDNYDGDITSSVQRTVENDTVYYTVTDSSGNRTTVTRPIQYGDFTAPDLKLLGDETITITAGTAFTDPGFTAIDNAEGDVSGKVQVTGKYNIYRSGTYTLTYTVTDNYGNTAEATRTLIVKAVPQPDVVDPGDKIIYLTFDDGPSKHTPRLLEVLEKYNVKATFFVVGEAGIGYLDEIVAGGHAIGIHTNTHEYSEIYANEEAFFKDLNAVRQIIYERTGIWTTLMRFPGGSSNTVSRKYCEGIMTTLTQAVTDQGFQYFDWNVSSGDAGGGSTTTEQVFNTVISGIQKHNVSIVLQHDIFGFSVDAVEQIITWGLANGYQFLPLDPTSPTCHQKVQN